MSARSLNKVQLIGNLTRDPELRYTPQGTAVCSFGMATNRSWTTDTGDKREETEWHRIVAWAKLAELCSQLLFKGRRIYVEGRLQTRQWTAQDGSPRSTTEVVIDDMIILDSKHEAGGHGGGGYGDDQYGGGGGSYQDDYSQGPSDDNVSSNSGAYGPKPSGTASQGVKPVIEEPMAEPAEEKPVIVDDKKDEKSVTDAEGEGNGKSKSKSKNEKDEEESDIPF